MRRFLVHLKNKKKRRNKNKLKGLKVCHRGLWSFKMVFGLFVIMISNDVNGLDKYPGITKIIFF